MLIYQKKKLAKQTFLLAYVQRYIFTINIFTMELSPAQSTFQLY